MADICKILFVYGTLLKGEERSHYLGDCKLVRTVEIPGSLYDTGMGYPVAVFGEGPSERISGELYLMPDPGGKLRELDLVEQVESGFYERVFLRGGGKDFLSYGAGPYFRNRTIDEHRIEKGNWRRFSSLAEGDPASFALNFENLQQKIYKDQGSSDTDGIIYVKGDLPVMVTAPHSTAHVRMGKLKRQEFFTGALAQILHNTTGCHVLYANSLTETDPNYYDDSAFKAKLSGLARESDLRLLIDLHGTGLGQSADIFPGTGEAREFLLGNDGYFDALISSSRSSGIGIGGEDVFPAAKQMTVAKFSARELGLPAIQLEIAQELRKPDSSPEDFVRLVGFLKDFISQLSFI